MSWGHITSRDLLTWTRTGNQPSLRPDQKYDNQGVFTGCLIPPMDSSSGPLTIFYSSVQKLPFHWSTPPYPRNAAGLSMATSSDGGHTWQKSVHNPILPGEPSALGVTGFRDPYVSAWPQLDQLRGEQGNLYGLVSGGVEELGPTSFLYALTPENPDEWRYLGPLVDLPARYQAAPKWSGNFGLNWECVNFMTLTSQSTSKDFLIIGAEGDVEREHIRDHKLPLDLPARTVRGQLFMSGELQKQTDSGIRFLHKSSGYLDHGSYYAANSFVDSPSGRRIVYGWIPEEDCMPDHAHRKGWNGALSIPREAFLLSIKGVQRAIHSPLNEISSVEVTKDEDGSTTLYTLGIRPLSEIEQTYRTSLGAYTGERFSLPSASSPRKPFCRTKSPTWALEATISVSTGCEAAGFYIRHNEDLSVVVPITFSPRQEEIVVDRTASTSQTNVNKCPEKGSFTLFETIHGQSGIGTWEKLHLRIFSDGDVLEIFANDRFALATMAYTGDYDVNNGITAYATGAEGCAVFENLRVYDGLNGMKSLIIDAFED